MSTYITESRSKYEVADCKLGEAVKWLVGNRCDDVRTAAYRSNTSIVTSGEEMFGGEVAYSWHEEVTEFMERFCLPGSYATFRDDEGFYWYMAELMDDGSVEWAEEPIENPFEKRCDELEKE